jgi:transposase
VKAIARAKIKTDKRDSEVLAHLLRMKMIPEVYRRSQENRQAQRVLRQRAFYVSAMTALKNRVHALLAQQREEVREESREAQLIRTIPGFGKYLAVLVAVEIADVNRFADAAHLHAYAGVIPSTHSSGDRTHHGKSLRAGNRWLRWAAVEAVWPGVRADFDLRCLFERLARNKGANKAKVATARRLLTIIYNVLKEGRNYVAYRR